MPLLSEPGSSPVTNDAGICQKVDQSMTDRTRQRCPHLCGNQGGTAGDSFGFALSSLIWDEIF